MINVFSIHGIPGYPFLNPLRVSQVSAQALPHLATFGRRRPGGCTSFHHFIWATAKGLCQRLLVTLVVGGSRDGKVIESWQSWYNFKINIWEIMRNQSEIDSESLIDPATPLLTREYYITSNNQHQALVNLSGLHLPSESSKPSKPAARREVMVQRYFLGKSNHLLLRHQTSDLTNCSQWPYCSYFRSSLIYGWSCHQTPDSKDLGWLHVQGLRLVSKKLAGNSRDPMISIMAVAYTLQLTIPVWQVYGKLWGLGAHFGSLEMP